MNFDCVYYEPAVLDYPLGKQLHEQFSALEWHPIDSHNRIDEMISRPNSDFAKMKRHLILGVRKTHKYTENHKISDFLVPYTSSGCSAMCLYCYLVCNYNKCSYLRLFVNREQMLDKLIRTAQKSECPMTFEIGSNSDLVLENTITGNLEWTILQFAQVGQGRITFPTKFHQVEPLLNLNHGGKTIFRMSVNPQEIIQKIELGTSPLEKRIDAANRMCEAGYPTGLLIAPVVLVDGWEKLYAELITQLADLLSPKLKRQLVVEIILMTYSNIHRFINQDAFPNVPELYDKNLMTGRARGKFGYNQKVRQRAEELLKAELAQKLPEAKIAYIC
ncbi:MAG: spore photoproduct lyase [Oscillospiraceae bacterium]